MKGGVEDLSKRDHLRKWLCLRHVPDEPARNERALADSRAFANDQPHVSSKTCLTRAQSRERQGMSTDLSNDYSRACQQRQCKKPSLVAWRYCILNVSLNAQKNLRGLSPINSFRMCKSLFHIPWRFLVQRVNSSAVRTSDSLNVFK